MLLPIISSIFIIYQKKWYNIRMACVLSSFYYLLIPIAGIRAFLQIFTNPFFWDKTEHGVSKQLTVNE